MGTHSMTLAAVVVLLSRQLFARLCPYQPAQPTGSCLVSLYSNHCRVANTPLLLHIILSKEREWGKQDLPGR
ncbi:hypothetical protein L210DRAFT_2194787 [Boletus edulis BED1]|uniref:Secreted protein n=1 Tax=Boletus edulis BED1 TaxID=1328754 RepID=A0AAD4BU80_BOLED|nr:hypothetical protein L210DRAFT_2194787 [Boletus edulis BED1]